MEKLSLDGISPIGVEASSLDLVILSEAKDLRIAKESEILKILRYAQNDAFHSTATVETDL